MVDYKQKQYYTVDDLKEIVALLRSPGGCPWDIEQTHESIRRGFLEETYEVVEAIDENNLEHLQEELGDVLLQVIFHAQIEEENKNFNLDDVADAECKKLIYRHPHVFGSTNVSGTGEVLENWEALKQIEHGQESQTDVLNGVARTLPALWRAEKVQKKAEKAGFAWENEQQILTKVSEECEEVCKAANGNGDIAEELGDLLFATVAECRAHELDPEELLHNACEKFIRRFQLVEQQCPNMTETPAKELLDAWHNAKLEEES